MVMCYLLWYQVAVTAMLRCTISGRSRRETCQISTGLLGRLKGIQEISQSDPLDKVRVPHATFCGKHSAQQMDSKLFDTCWLHFKGSSLELIMETHPGTLHPSICSGPLLTGYDLEQLEVPQWKRSAKNLSISDDAISVMWWLADQKLINGTVWHNAATEEKDILSSLTVRTTRCFFAQGDIQEQTVLKVKLRFKFMYLKVF